MMFKQLCRLQRYTFLHELPNVFNTFLHELSSHAYTFLHELSSYYVHDNRFPILFIIIDCLHILPQFLVERMLRHRVLVPRMMSFMRALVIATFMRRRSFRNPICPSSLERTREMRITSLSCPWKPSTVFTLIRRR